MDETLRTLERRLRALPDDAATQAEYRQALARAHPRPELCVHLDQVEGVLTRPWAVNLDWRAPEATWARSSRAWLPPTAPAGAWREAWRESGAARWLSSAAVLVQSPSGTLYGLDPRSGARAWDVPSQRGREEESATRSVLYTRVGWALAPWGAVEVVLRRELDWQLERPSREESAERVDVAVAEFTLELTVLRPGPAGWSLDAPQVLRLRAEPGEPLGEVLPPLEHYDDDLLELVLDEHQPLLALRWGDEGHDWAVWRVLDDALLPEPWTLPANERPFGSTWRTEPSLLLRAGAAGVEVRGLPEADPGPHVSPELFAGRGLSECAEGPKSSRVLVQAGWLYACLGDDAFVALEPAD